MQVLVKNDPFKMERKCTGDGYGGGGCWSLLLVEPNDLSYDYLRGEIFFKCPICGVKTGVMLKEIPRELIKSRFKK